MPCPYFDPRQIVERPTLANARLPLIDEYDGVCRAHTDSIPVEAATRMRLCNHGNARGGCEHFPAEEQRSAFRFEVLRRSAAHLDVLFIEEVFYAPLSWRRHEFRMEGEQLEPDMDDCCQRAQMIAFCRSYLRQYPMETQIILNHVKSANK